MSEAFYDQANALVAASDTEGTAGLLAWSNSLRRKPLDAALAELGVLMECLLLSEKSPARLLEAFEAMRPGLHQINAARENASGQELADSYLEMLGHELDIHERLMMLTDGKDMDTMSFSIHRSLAALIDRQLVYYQNYLPIPAKEWVRIHRMFYLATQRKTSAFTTADKTYFPGKNLSILNLYCISLLLGCGRLNHFSPKEIARVSKALQDWCALVSITRNPSTSSDNQLVFDITSGSAPNFKKLFSPEKSSISCYLQVDKLIEKLDALFAEEIKRESNPALQKSTTAFGMETQPLRSDIIQHLKSAWTEYIYREERIETDESVQVCLGLNNIFFYLAGAQALKDFIGTKISLSIVYDDHEDATGIKQNRSGDIWSAFVSAPDGSLVTGDIPAEYNFQHYFPNKDPQATHADYPVLNIRMSDTHSRGCCLQWASSPENAPEIGDLVGLCRNDSQGHWHIGEVAWKFQSDAGEISTGIRLLSTKAIPVAVDVPLRLGLHENHTAGILFPPEEQLHTSAVTLVISPLKLNQQEYIDISQKGIEEKVHLNKLLKANSGYESYECAFVVKPPSLSVERAK
jgi:hypothetical protein